MLKHSLSWSVLIYGCILILLGYWGYLQGSKVSLYSGGSFGLLLVISSLFMFAGKKIGFYGAILFTALLGLVFSIRYAFTGKSLPAILAVLSGAMFLFILLKSAHWRRKKSD